MTRPLTKVERSVYRRNAWLREEERQAVEKRGEIGRMEFWLRITRARIAKDAKDGRSDVFTGFAIICRLFGLVVDKRAAGDARLWNQLMQYAQQVLEMNDPRH